MQYTITANLLHIYIREYNGTKTELLIQCDWNCICMLQWHYATVYCIL